MNNFLGFPVTIDPTMPPGTLEFRDRDGRVVGRIINFSDGLGDHRCTRCGHYHYDGKVECTPGERP